MKNYLQVCYKTLHNIYKDGAYSNIELNKQLSNIKDKKAIITKVVYGTIENDIKLEYIIKKLAPKVKDLPVKIVLKMGSYMVLNLNVPDYAVVNECVKLTKSIGFTSASGLVNAVLKKVANKDFSLPDEKNFVKYLSINYSKPEWFVKMLINDYGKEMARDFLATTLDDSTCIRVNTAKISEAEFKSLLRNNKVEHRDTPLGNVLYVDYSKLNGLQQLNGLYTVQNIGSIIICDSAEVSDKSNILDVCAAPGGKTMYLATLNPNGTVEAWDLHEHRINLVEKYRERMGLNNVIAKVCDASVLHKGCTQKYDLVMCDVPCSGLGVVNSKPDILIDKTEESIAELPEIQYKILDNCSNYVKLGGTLIYSTCTINKKENSEVIKRFLENHKDFKVDYKTPEKFEVYSDEYGFTTLANLSHTEGFFFSRLIRV